MTNQKTKIFLSYAHEDIGMAKRIYQDLKRYGLDVWFDNESLLPGQDWENEIEKAIETSKYFLVLLSSKGMSERGYVHKEIRLALNIFDKCPEDEIFMIPIRLDDCQPAHRRIKKINWINLFPESEYKNGLNKILKVINPIEKFLRSKPSELESDEVVEMIKKNDFFDKKLNPEGKGLNHRYNFQRINDDFILFEGATGLMWQQSGSDKYMEFEDAKKYINELNEKRFAGFKDWRLPTIEEAMSLVEPEEKNGCLHIDPVFHSRQLWIWTSDQVKDQSRPWVVYFGVGSCYWGFDLNCENSFVRAVRSRQSSSE